LWVAFNDLFQAVQVALLDGLDNWWEMFDSFQGGFGQTLPQLVALRVDPFPVEFVRCFFEGSERTKAVIDVPLEWVIVFVTTL